MYYTVLFQEPDEKNWRFTLEKAQGENFPKKASTKPSQPKAAKSRRVSSEIKCSQQVQNRTFNFCSAPECGCSRHSTLIERDLRRTNESADEMNQTAVFVVLRQLFSYLFYLEKHKTLS